MALKNRSIPDCAKIDPLWAGSTFHPQTSMSHALWKMHLALVSEEGHSISAPIEGETFIGRSPITVIAPENEILRRDFEHVSIWHPVL